MNQGIRLHVCGENACFTRPEMKVERVSYDVITPSAARGILEAIHWKPAIRWVVTRLRVLKPIRFESIRRNEVGHKIPVNNVKVAMNRRSLDGLCLLVNEDRQQRAATILRSVAYVIEARFELTVQAGPDDNPGKHLDTFSRRARKGQCFHQPALGCREFPAHFRLLEPGEPPPDPDPLLRGERDLGWMLLDIDYADDRRSRFFRPVMRNGIIDIPPLGEVEAAV